MTEKREGSSDVPRADETDRRDAGPRPRRTRTRSRTCWTSSWSSLPRSAGCGRPQSPTSAC